MFCQVKISKFYLFFKFFFQKFFPFFAGIALKPLKKPQTTVKPVAFAQNRPSSRQNTPTPTNP
jgi:hypothetical protein